MKFGKEFVSQMVPEWREAYMDYNYLKTTLKDILRLRQRNKQEITAASNGALMKSTKKSIYRAFSGLTRRYSMNLRGSPKARSEEEQVILANEVQQLDGSDEGCYYQTMFLKSLEEGGELEMMFFRRLDHEFNKVNKFYIAKVEQVLMEAEKLNKQMDALIALRYKVEVPVAAPGDQYERGRAHMNVIHEGVEMSSSTEHLEDVGEENMNISDSRSSSAPLEILNQVKINVQLETPWSTLKGMLKDSRSKDLTFSKQEVKEAEQQLKMAFIEFYKRLRLLKSYSFLNLLAFSKIMKKYDKITARRASKTYLKMVDDSYLGSSDEVTRLIDRVEATFIKHFSNGNRKKGNSALRPKEKNERHRITFFLGLLLGCSVALVVAIGIVIHARNIFKSEGRGRYMENIFPLYSLFGFVVLHMLMYSANIYFWRRYRVNYPFIFGFKQGTELGYREVFLLSAGLAVIALAGVVSNLDMDMEPHTKSFKALTELVPLALFVVVLTIIFCPFNIIYRSSRFFLIQCAFHCICAPLYKVVLSDFFLADQLTSQVQALRSLEFYICYYGWGHFKRRSNNCQNSNIYNVFYLVVAIIPYWIRSVQCFRRLFEEKEISQAWNGLRYFSTIVAVAMRTGYELNRRNSWQLMAGASSIITTLANTYWDIVVDWGLLQRHSKNRWLRDKLLVPNKSVYFVAMIFDVVLRFAWLQTLLDLRTMFFFHRTAVTAIFACLEILRRGIWNFFRLENEHLYNVGKYRAFKSVPFPFNYDDDEGKE